MITFLLTVQINIVQIANYYGNNVSASQTIAKMKQNTSMSQVLNIRMIQRARKHEWKYRQNQTKGEPKGDNIKDTLNMKTVIESHTKKKRK